MSNKAFATLVVFILILIAVPILFVCFWEEPSEQTLPTLTCTVNTEEPGQEKVTISVVAETTNSSEIASITLPDSTVVYDNTTDYVVTKNGTYTFETETKKGQKTSKKLEITNILEYSAANPYIPSDFSYLEGETTNRICHSR